MWRLDDPSLSLVPLSSAGENVTRLEALRLIVKPPTKKETFLRAWTRWVLSSVSPTASVNGSIVNEGEQ